MRDFQPPVTMSNHLNTPDHAITVKAKLAAILLFVIAAVTNCTQLYAAAAGKPRAASLRPQTLRVESQDQPIGVAGGHPSFSWTLAAVNPADRGLRQTKFRLLVSSSLADLAKDRGDLWDTGEQLSATTIQTVYAGEPLQSHTTYYWKLRVTDQQGSVSGWSRPASFTTGLLQASDWKAKWIAAEADSPPVRASDDVSAPHDTPKTMPIFRNSFAVQRPVAQALVFVSGVGQYELHLNGKPVTHSVLNPGWTDYRKTVLYDSYDVTALMRHGENVFGVMLGNGMYNVPGVKGRYTKFIGSFGQPKLIMQMHIKFADGTESTIVSDGSWTTSPGPITFSSTYGGEDYDAQKAQAGWDAPGFSAGAWRPALEVAGPGGVLTGGLFLPIEVAQTFQPVKTTEPAPGILVYDLGQNFSGWPHIKVRGPAGATIKLIGGELLDKDGRVTQHSANASPADANIYAYTLSGKGEEEWRPRFSYYGFRYVEVQGAARSSSAGKPQLIALNGEFLHAAVATDGAFHSSDPLFNGIHKLIDMAILSNMVSVLTDCPHREKLGWLEQTHLAGASIMLKYGVEELYRKMADDMRDSQLADGLVPAIAPEYVAFLDRNGVNTAFRDSPEWGSASILSAWTAYQFYGNRQTLADHYESMKRYAAYLQGKAKEHLLSYGLGDWYDVGPKPPGVSQLTSKSVTATAIYYQDLAALSKIAALLGKDADAQAYAAEMTAVKDAFNTELFHPETHSYDRGSQTANAMPLVLGLVPDDQRAGVLDSLVKDIRDHQNRVTAGDIGFHYVVRALSDGGRSDVLYDMLSRTDSPSYGYQLAQGATTLTEAWDTNPDSSQNHFMLGHGEEWFYRGLAGIDFDLGRPAPRQIVIRPAMPGKIAETTGRYNSVLGPIESSWSRTATRRTMHVIIPAGAVATIYFPVGHEGAITEGGGQPLAKTAGISEVRAEAGSIACTAASGDYSFAIEDR